MSRRRDEDWAVSRTGLKATIPKRDEIELDLDALEVEVPEAPQRLPSWTGSAMAAANAAREAAPPGTFPALPPSLAAPTWDAEQEPVGAGFAAAMRPVAVGTRTAPGERTGSEERDAREFFAAARRNEPSAVHRRAPSDSFSFADLDSISHVGTDLELGDQAFVSDDSVYDFASTNFDVDGDSLGFEGDFDLSHRVERSPEPLEPPNRLTDVVAAIVDGSSAPNPDEFLQRPLTQNRPAPDRRALRTASESPRSLDAVPPRSVARSAEPWMDAALVSVQPPPPQPRRGGTRYASRPAERRDSMPVMPRRRPPSDDS